jgi:hypothetical protein
VDPKYEENERKYAEIKAEILGDSDSEDEESGSDVDSDEDEQGEFRCLDQELPMLKCAYLRQPHPRRKVSKI